MLEKKMSLSEAGLRQRQEEGRLGRSAKAHSSFAMPEIIENDTPENEMPTKDKHRKKKKNRETHNAVERHRKKKINSGINRIGELIPCSPTLKQSKNMILDQAFKYINELKRQNDELLLNGGDKEQADEIVRLRKQLLSIQKENARYISLLKANDICLYDDPTIHWRGNLKNAKAPLLIPNNEGQKNIIVYSNGSPLGVNNQSVSFNVSQNMQKQTANVVPVQRTCNIMAPSTNASACATENKSWQQTACASTSHQQIPLCGPVTLPAQAILKISTSESPANVPYSAATNTQDVIPSEATGHLQCAPQSDQNVLESSNGQQNVSLANIALSQDTSAPLTATVMTQEPPRTSITCSGFQESFVVTVTDAASDQTTRTAISGTLPSANINPIIHLTNSGRSLATSAVAETVAINTLPATTISTLPVSCLDSGWALSNSLQVSSETSNLTKVSSLTRIPTSGNTQTTWTTLQVAGNTIQPLNHASHNNLPIFLNEQANCTGTLPATNGIQTIRGISLNTTLQVDGQAVSLPSCPPTSVQPLCTPSPTKTQPAKAIVPLNPAMQVIQMASPLGTTVNPAPANQNVIILKPPNPTPCPSQTVGQQIVIIQSPSNPNPLPLLSAQPPGATRMPLQGTNHVLCTNGPAQNAPTPQIFGGKHLVHILPRPSPTSSAPCSAQSFSVAMSNQQQPSTISLNGQLFALQPMMPSYGATHQTPMQLIQPITTEDPITNVALNTFGALASLSQSLSQAAGQSCVQLSINHPTITPTTESSQMIPSNCVSLSTTATSPKPSEKPTVLHAASNAAKPLPGLSSNVKCKRISKKSGVKKRPSSTQVVPQVNVAASASTSVLDCQKASKSLSNAEKEAQMESTSMISNPSVRFQESAMPSENGVSNSDCNSNEICNSEQMGLHSESDLNRSTVRSPLLPKSVAEKDIVLDESVCKDLIPLAEETNRSQGVPITNSVSLECSKECVMTSSSTSSSTVKHILADHVCTPSTDHSSSNVTCAAEVVSTSEPKTSMEESPSIMQAASDLLEGQDLGKVLYDISKEKTTPTESPLFVVNELQHSTTAGSKSIDSDKVPLPGNLMPNVAENVDPEHTSVCEQEVVVGCSSVPNRQADSPMSTSSGSNRSFSVASMLPDTSREDVTNATPLTSVFNISPPSESTDIVALAARAIFDQGNTVKKKVNIQVDVREGLCKTTKEAPVKENRPPPFMQTFKDKGTEQFVTPPEHKHSQDSNPQTNAGGPIEKPNCSSGIEATSLPMHISTSQSQNVTSLSINNLIHPVGVTHPFVSCSNVSQPSDQMSTTIPTDFPRPSVLYDNPSPAPAVTTEYSQEHFHAFRTTVMQASQTQEANQKQNREHRKDSAKRTVEDDHLLSTAKRQKHCESAPVRQDQIASMRGTADDFDEQTQMFDNQMPHNSSNSLVSVSSHAPTNSFNTLFSTNVTFVNSALRQTDVRCNSQPVLADQQGQSHTQHLQQRGSSQTANHLQNSNPYLKQQQVGQFRERHLLYQQHHTPHPEGTIHSQPHNVHQQRAVQQDVQMQKKRNAVQVSQANQPSLQQKHHVSDQGRQKGNQAHAHHHQQMQQQMQQHFSTPQGEKSCDNPAGNRNHQGTHQQSHLNSDLMHQQQQEVGNRQQSTGTSLEHTSTHNQLQRLLTSRSMEHHMVSQPSIVSRQSNMACAPHRQERNRVSSYSAEALIGKTSNSEQRMGISNQGPRVSDQLEMRTYLDVSRTKALPIHNLQTRISVEHALPSEVQRLSDCQSYKPGISNQQPTVTYELQSSRNSEMGNTVSSLRGMQSQAFRIGQNSVPGLDRQKRLPYAPVQGIPIGNAMPPRDIENSCHQSFMQSLLGPHLGEPVVGSQRLISDHQRTTQCGVSGTLEYGCPTGRESVQIRRDSESQSRETCDMSMGVINSRNNLSIPFSSSSSGEVQGRNTSPHISVQKSNPMRITESQGSKSHLIANVSTNVHAISRASHPAISHGSTEQGQTSVRQSNPPVNPRSRHPLQDSGSSKARQPERTRSSNPRHGNVFEPSLPHLPLAPSSSMLLGRQPSSTEKRSSIVRFMSDGSQVPSDNTAPDQHTLSQNFGFPFIPDGGMNPTINANTAFIPPVSQSSATRAPALIPVDPQNTLPSFYPPYSPAHPSLSNDLSIPYFSNQIFTNPSTEKPNSASLNNRFGSILSPPRPVGFAQPSFPLLADMPPMHMANPSHLSNFNLTSLFPEIATALPDGSAMSPLLSIVNSATTDSSKQSSNRPAHNISHILGHDCSSAV
ncbi:basic helix-loop-helix domain-containing protein USF3 [Ambystoma mexicanum]|uniref:basic helix-loop-helix domain-containing protein USF3 n=1 Tax=Ambystoma mexicanum TaxID=8296 RepID=UPI0037E94282